MANEPEARRGAGQQGEGNPHTERRQPIGGGAISRPEETGGPVGGEGHVSQQSNTQSQQSNTQTDGGEPSNQTSTATDEKGQL